MIFLDELFEYLDNKEVWLTLFLSVAPLEDLYCLRMANRR
jgi:hypothetical protein